MDACRCFLLAAWYQCVGECELKLKNCQNDANVYLVLMPPLKVKS